MKVIGLTGGIASGKSTVSKMLKELGAVVIDVDLIGRNVLCQGTIAYNKVIQSFGSGIVLPDGEINRKELGRMVFSDSDKLKCLNQITHPAIIDKVKAYIEELDKQNTAVAVVDAAILIEMGLNKLVDCIWLVVVDSDTQLQRVMERDKLSHPDALNRINSQMTNEQRMQYADTIIDTNYTVEVVQEHVKKLWINMLSGENSN